MATEAQTWHWVEKLIARVEQHDMSFILYLSMASGGPSGTKWSEEGLFVMVRSLCAIGVRHISLADTGAAASPAQVRRVFQRAKAEQPQVRFNPTALADDRCALARDGALVHGGDTFNDFPVPGDVLARLNQDNIALAEFGRDYRRDRRIAPR